MAWTTTTSDVLAKPLDEGEYIMSRYQLLLTYNYKKTTHPSHAFSIYDAAFLVVDSCNSYCIVDRSGLHFPLHNAYPRNFKKYKGMEAYSFKELNTSISLVCRRFSIDTVWVYMYNSILQRLWSLKGINIYNLQSSLVDGSVVRHNPKTTTVNLPTLEEDDSDNKSTMRNITKMIFLITSNLVAGYEIADNRLYLDKIHANACDAHRFVIEDDRHLCATTLVMINRLSLLLLHQLHIHYRNLGGERAIDSLLRTLLVKMFYPADIEWVCKRSENILDVSTKVLQDDGHQLEENIFERFKDHMKYIRGKNQSYVDHSTSDMVTNVIKLFGCDPDMYPHVQHIP